MSWEIVLTIQNGPLEGNQYIFKDPQLCLIGRGEDCEIRLPGDDEYRDVSRYHCLLAVDPPHVSIRDLGSRNGTRVNGVLVGRRTDWPDLGAALLDRFPLCDGDELEVGRTVFLVRGAVPADSPPALVGDERPGPRPRVGPATPLALDARTAADLMTPYVVSIQASATVAEAETLLTERGFTALPVMGDDGAPVGVLSRADVLAFDCEENNRSLAAAPEPPAAGARPSRVLRIEGPGATRVQDIMTQTVFSVAPETPAAKVVEALLTLKVHRLFVADPEGNLLGVVSMTDVLRHLHRPAGAPAVVPVG
jgi:CBS domain-containing protein